MTITRLRDILPNLPVVFGLPEPEAAASIGKNSSAMAACRGRAASMGALFLMLTSCAPHSKLYRTRPEPSPTHGRT
jgi:hypothetical protein